MKKYLFQSDRLGFRTWTEGDLDAFHAINSDPEVMYFFQKTFSKQESLEKMKTMNSNFEKDGFCYFAVDHLDTGELAGTLGMGRKTFTSNFTPCVDIGWRFKKTYWNQGLATEGALACIDFARKIGLKKLYSYASKANTASTRVMQKIGMDYLEDFNHSELENYTRLQPFSVYQIKL